MVGKTAFIALLGLGAITGITSYYLFAKVSPSPGVMVSLYRKDLPKTNNTLTSMSIISAGSKTNRTTSTTLSGPVGATITVLQEASIQGNPAFDPSVVKVKRGNLIQVTNRDSVPHTVTNGKGADDPNTGKLFDTSIINAGESARIDTSKLTVGQAYPFHCTIHPYMTGTLKVA
jgi:plastocyanin